MAVQIGNKEQVAQWTVLDTNARNNRIQLSEVIDGIEWVIALHNILSPGIDDYKLEATPQVEGQKVFVELRLFGESDLPQDVWSSNGIQVFRQINRENLLVTYSLCFYVRSLLYKRWATDCLYHFFLYKETETLPPVSQ